MRFAGWSIARRLGIAYAVLLVVAAAGVVVSLLYLDRLHTSVNRRSSVIQPAEIRNKQLLLDLVDQETGVRGFAISADEDNLMPYQQGVSQERADVAQLHVYLGHDPRFDADIATIESRADSWRTSYAIPLVRAVRAGGPAAASSVGVQAGKPAFDQIRAASDVLNGDLIAAARPARRQAGTAFDVLIGLISFSVAVLLVAIGAVYVANRRWVVLPLGRLGRDVRAVSAGDLSHEVEGSGPPDVRHLADDVDVMRRRLVEQIAAVESARSEVAAAARLVQEQADNLSRSNRDLEQFAYVASHDLQEPLRKVASFCQLLERRYAGSLDERGEQYIAFAVDGAKRMQQLINDLLAFSRVGRTAASFEPVPLTAAVGRATASLPSVGETSATVDYGELPVVLGELSLLSQLFQNLIGNAVKFRAPDRDPVVSVTAAVRGDSCEVAVSDNGIGIDSEYAEKIFVIFQRLHARDTYAGTGIGLALCRRIVEFHGGKIWLDTGGSGGATFRFTLPLAMPAPVPVGAGSGLAAVPGN